MADLLVLPPFLLHPPTICSSLCFKLTCNLLKFRNKILSFCMCLQETKPWSDARARRSCLSRLSTLRQYISFAQMRYTNWVKCECRAVCPLFIPAFTESSPVRRTKANQMQI
eukprot:TRINITY_DN1487_c0_g1_i5.p1 TRINITY_DN1487_c0_g1~~TRINITY_DN1487_c0_g1_i5.p1  ORF type:complete len:112 (+),score=6.83 TRINITY_DN1487_c0_g1_i5:210-545(+)